MALEVYVGPLSRYCAEVDRGVVEQRGADRGHFQKVVVAWRVLVSQGLGQLVDWSEDAVAPQYTGQVGFESYVCLQVLAAALDRGESELGGQGQVPQVHIDHPVWRAAAGGPSPRFPHLYFSDLWLPCDFEATLASVDPSGHRATIGSSVRLLGELREIDRRSGGGGCQGGLFGEAARCGLAVLLDLAEKSAAQRLPMCFHY